MANLKLPFIAWRDGRPRFNPGPRERELGYKGEDLRHPGGAWFSLEETAAWSTARLAEIHAARDAGRRPRPRLERGRTLGELLGDWVNSEDVAGLAPATQRNYRSLVHCIMFRPGAPKDARVGDRAHRELISLAPVTAIDKPEVKAAFLAWRKARGWGMALQMVGAISNAWSWGELDVTWRLKGRNPAARLRLDRPKGRIVIYTDAEIRGFLEAADRIGRPSIGDAIILGLFTCQRQADRLELVDGGLVGGRRRFVQNKTGAIVEIPETPQLVARLATARARVAELKLRKRTRPDTIIVSEETGLPYTGSGYRHVYGLVRAAAPGGKLAHLRDSDLRDTGVTWLARAGATLPEIAAVSGHSMQSIHQILKHYLAITPELADAAVAKLKVWMEREGVAVS